MSPTNRRSGRPYLPPSRTEDTRSALRSRRRKIRSDAIEPITLHANHHKPATVGVVYLSFGQEYKALTILSLSFLRRFGYAGPVRVVTDSCNWNVGHLDCELMLVPFRGMGFATRYYKTQIHQYAFDTTLYLDADTLPIASIRPIWHELRSAKVCLPLDFHNDFQGSLSHVVQGCQSDPREYRYMAKQRLLQHVFYNSDVILFRRSSACDRLFETWHEEWNRFGLRDQLALVRAVARTKSNVHILPPRWNGRLRSFGSIQKALEFGMRILHLRPGIDVCAESGSEMLLKSALAGRFNRMPRILSATR
jgi:hypothetical protein